MTSHIYKKTTRYKSEYSVIDATKKRHINWENVMFAIFGEHLKTYILKFELLWVTSMVQVEGHIFLKAKQKTAAKIELHIKSTIKS